MASSPEEDRAHYLIKKLAGYILLYQQCSDKLRPHGRTKMDPVYDEAYKDWKSDPKNPLVEPPLQDQAKCDEYFATCDKICALEPQTPHEYVVGFSAFLVCL